MRLRVPATKASDNANADRLIITTPLHVLAGSSAKPQLVSLQTKRRVNDGANTGP
jgi:hypothetical protein